MHVELIKTWRGYEIKTDRGYIAGYHNGKYKYTLDYTYSRKYALKTAQKHADALRKEPTA